MTLKEMLCNKPPAKSGLKSRADIRRQLENDKCKLVVVDDDPTGTQTVSGIRVYMDWSVPTLERALAREDAVFYVSTNSRAYPENRMRDLTLEFARNLRAAADTCGVRVLMASRSDSTLRGHYPAEVDALLSGCGLEADGVIIAPALFEAGRYTIDDIHWVEEASGERGQAGQMIMAGDTEFARDPNFGYTKSNLREWVEEKTGGRWKAAEVLSLSLETLREKGGEGALQVLLGAKGGVPIILNAAAYEDIETAVLALAAAEKEGKRFIYRCAACFVKVRGGFLDRPLLTAGELGLVEGPGLVVVGSYVGKTSRQLERLLQAGGCEALELNVDTLAGEPSAAQAEVRRVSGRADAALAAGRTAVVYTSRSVRKAGGREFLDFGSRVMTALCDTVRAVTKRPSFVIAKGGITSVEIAKTGLGVREAYVAGQIAKSVPLWELGPETKWPGIHYVVFPGNVGNDDTLTEVVAELRK
ncbi:MAG: hypothetical protein LBK13_00770 [Spirochaetales bacterium]|jgi:uncharacterized protein YgbK (DUF1537 family)|nr:hypothetical protein [Spirochaetales bacterium]